MRIQSRIMEQESTKPPYSLSTWDCPDIAPLRRWIFQSGGEEINMTNSRKTYPGRNKLGVYFKDRLPSKTENICIINVKYPLLQLVNPPRGTEWVRADLYPPLRAVFYQGLRITQRGIQSAALRQSTGSYSNLRI